MNGLIMAFKRWQAKRIMLRVARTMTKNPEDIHEWMCPLRAAFGQDGWDNGFVRLFGTKDACDRMATIFTPADQFRYDGLESDRAACIAAIEALG